MYWAQNISVFQVEDYDMEVEVGDCEVQKP
jgi:hypothetical protein